MKYPCTRCGSCCRKMERVAGLNRGDGVCRFLDERTDLCTVYATRPLQCRVDDSYTMRFRSTMSARTYYMAQVNRCTKLNPINAALSHDVTAALQLAGLD
ncbi:YkgJ family cysteine cluster protein [Chitinivorax sp. B]|uniref:YkgJ family cysteine cluster protein n=1 Tax=Chitinivorax sp. B TaxID=2502235 RepID=UPI0010F9A660|nr:YkgJ family cysteine cluster protein [Chitinivorax sp. B]